MNFIFGDHIYDVEIEYEKIRYTSEILDIQLEMLRSNLNFRDSISDN